MNREKEEVTRLLHFVTCGFGLVDTLRALSARSLSRRRWAASCRLESPSDRRTARGSSAAGGRAGTGRGSSRPACGSGARSGRCGSAARGSSACRCRCSAPLLAATVASEDRVERWLGQRLLYSHPCSVRQSCTETPPAGSTAGTGSHSESGSPTVSSAASLWLMRSWSWKNAGMRMRPLHHRSVGSNGLRQNARRDGRGRPLLDSREPRSSIIGPE
eukprot:COSAG04_NODE_678_length_11212_cov_65.028795_2_plen_217_part_00